MPPSQVPSASKDTADHPATLGELFERAGIALPEGADSDLALQGFTDDSRAVVAEGGFLAVAGETVDGHQFIPQALERGAAVVIAEERLETAGAPRTGRILPVQNTKRILGPLAQAWWGNPSRAMRTVGVTGTNGKTTTAWLIEALLGATGHSPALFGTLGASYGGESHATPTTTPGAFELAEAMARARQGGADAAAMEVSSHALNQRRADGVSFDVAVMTNLTQDHLDYHGTMEKYAEAKRLLFTRLAPEAAVFNADDPTACLFAAKFPGPKFTFSLDPKSGADVRPLGCEECAVDSQGVVMRLKVAGAEEDLPELRSPLRGRFNASNLLAAMAAGLALGIDPAEAIRALSGKAGPPGRFEAVDEGQAFSVYVDYAHTPDAVRRILSNVRDITSGRVIIALGCGGDRDASKRPLMGAAMGRLADHALITSDNPRSERPEDIARAMEEGLREEAGPAEYEVCLDRAEAIRRAIAMAREGDSVVIAGKGHEDYQEIEGERKHFDDREVVREALREL